MPALLPEQWSALRVEWEMGGLSNVYLGKKYGVSEKAIRNRAIEGRWKRDPETLTAAQQAGQMRAAVRAAPPPPPEPEPDPIVPPGPNPSDARTMRASVADRASSEVLKEVRDLTVEKIAEVVADAIDRDLGRIAQLEATFSQAHQKLTELLTSEDAEKATAAAQRLLAGRTDGVSSAIQALARLGESIQNQRRKALGFDDRPKRLEHSGPGGGPIESRAEQVQVVDMQKLPTTDLAKLLEAAMVLEGSQGRPPMPMPPGVGPVNEAEPEQGEDEEQDADEDAGDEKEA